MGCGSTKVSPSAIAHLDTNPKPGVLLCNDGHRLVLTSFAEGNYSSNAFTCRKCGSVGKCSEGRFFCSACIYDVCKACAQKAGVAIKPELIPVEVPSPKQEATGLKSEPTTAPPKKPAEVDAMQHDASSRAFQSAKIIRKLKGKLTSNGKMLKTFNAIDLDKSHNISLDEFDKYIKRYLQRKQANASEGGKGEKPKGGATVELNPELVKNVSEIMTLYDANKNGVIDYNEFQIAYFDIFMFCLKKEVEVYAFNRADFIKEGYRKISGHRDGAEYLLELLKDSVRFYKDIIIKAAGCGLVIKEEEMLTSEALKKPTGGEFTRDQLFTLLNYLFKVYDVAEIRKDDVQVVLEDLAQMQTKFRPAEISLAVYCVLMVAINVTKMLEP